MKLFCVRRLILCSSALVLFPLPCTGLAVEFAGGTGDPDTPYEIVNASQLISIGSDSNLLDRCYVLANDIDLDPNVSGGRVFETAVIAPDTDRSRHGFQGAAFTGCFDGQGYSVTGLTIYTTNEYAGLFGRIECGGMVHDVHLAGGVVRGGAQVSRSGAGGTGALVADNRGLIKRCRTDLRTIGEAQVGGMVGQNRGTILGCLSTGAVFGTYSVGGLVGVSYGTISNCVSAGPVYGEGDVGGLAGYHCLFGKFLGEGDVGDAEYRYYFGMVLNSYSKGTVHGAHYVGGLIGTASGCVANSYSTGAVFATNSAGGLVGRGAPHNISGCFWDVQTSGVLESMCGHGLTTHQMQDPNTYLSAGWDVLGERDNGVSEHWILPGDGEYPELSVFRGFEPPLPHGSGTLADPHIIRTPTDLGTVWYRHTANYRLADDIDLSGMVLSGPMVSIFAGEFDGQGHKIRNLSICGGGNLGLFGSLLPEATISRVRLENVNVVGTGNTIGGLAGHNSGTVLESYNSGSVVGACFVGGLAGHNSGYLSYSYGAGSVEGETDVGGLVGQNDFQGTISQSYSTGKVSATGGRIGGLVGWNSGGVVSNGYSSASVSGVEGVGGLIGHVSNSWSIISNSYSTGAVLSTTDTGVGGLVGSRTRGLVLSCVWDVETSGVSGSQGGTGLITSEMRDVETFLHYGWDWIDEADNGTDDIWKMWDAYDYPRLQWEPGPNTPLVFVNINDSGAGMKDQQGNPLSHGGFNGQMSRYETTNDQYCQYLNEALADGLIVVDANVVYASIDANRAEPYFDTYEENPYSQITYSGDSFSVRIRDGYSMGNHPVSVNWWGATAFCDYYGYRLPTVWEWQAVADFDGSYLYGCGVTRDPGEANWGTANPLGLTSYPYTTPVDHYPVYGYGLCDMAGNVWEWTSTLSEGNRAVCGGSWAPRGPSCMVADHYYFNPDDSDGHTGFRVCH